MRLFAIFLVLKIQLSLISASPPNLLPLPSQTNHDVEGYECGNLFFSNYEVKKALSLALSFIDQGFLYPKKYKGKHYIGSGHEEYFLYPIKNGPKIMPNTKKINTVYFIFFKRNDHKEVDVVAQLTTDDYAKCIRRYRTHIDPSNLVPKNPNGYLCGQTFLTDDTVHQSLLYAQAQIGGNNKYPSPYFGSLYPKDVKYWIWPILRGKNLYRSGTDKIGPYFLILNNQREIADVVVKGFKNNFLRCLRIRKPPTAPESDPFSKLFVKPPRPGYICGKIFFNNKILEENAAIVKDKVAKAILSNLPEEYFGPPFNERCLILPIVQDGRLSKKGHRGQFYLFLTPEYNVKSVAMLINGKFKPCEKYTIVAKKNHDKSDYQCQEQLLSHQELVLAAEEACVKMNAAGSYAYPARCEGTGFKLDDPFFAYPVIPASFARKFKTNPGLYRVVINTNCEVTGALTTFLFSKNESLRKNKRKKYMRCHRLEDGSLLPDFFDANAKIVYC